MPLRVLLVAAVTLAAIGVLWGTLGGMGSREARQTVPAIELHRDPDPGRLSPSEFDVQPTTPAIGPAPPQVGQGDDGDADDG